MPEIRLTLLSDTTFSRGDGTAGEVDIEVVHDDLGLPYVPGRRIKGLLLEAWLTMAAAFPGDAPAARELFGEPRATTSDSGLLMISRAELPAELRSWVEFAVRRRDNPVNPGDVLRGFTDVRRQSARDRRTGAPAEGTLRASRAAIRGLTFVTGFETHGWKETHWRVLARTCLGVRHAGLGRNRGRGHLLLSIWDSGQDVTGKKAELHE